MRLSLSVLSFVTACFLGIGAAHLATVAIEWYSPAFTKEEATMIIGSRVRNIYWTDTYRGAKCPVIGVCADVKIGERGRVIGIKEVSPNEYFFVVQWDEPSQGEPMLSYFGRMSRRVFIEIDNTHR